MNIILNSAFLHLALVCLVLFSISWILYFFFRLLPIWNPTRSPKILILGHGRHGKDSVAELLNERHGVTFTSSSLAAAKIFIYDEIKNIFGYETFLDCYKDRNSSNIMRELWHNLIADYNLEDPARLAKEIIKDNDCYVGMRSDREIQACIEQNLFDIIVFVDAKDRVSEEPDTSFNIDIDGMIERNQIDFIINNNKEDPDLKLLTLQVDDFATKFL